MPTVVDLLPELLLWLQKEDLRRLKHRFHRVLDVRVVNEVEYRGHYEGHRGQVLLQLVIIHAGFAHWQVLLHTLEDVELEEGVGARCDISLQFGLCWVFHALAEAKSGVLQDVVVRNPELLIVVN